MKCLCCGKMLESNQSSSGWHNACIRKFFGTKTLPEIEVDLQSLKRLADESTQKGYTVTGVQKKLSLHLSTGLNQARLKLINYPAGYILKPQVEEFKNLPEAEYLAMSMAQASGIITVPYALILKNDEFAFITKRVDRPVWNKKTQILAMEDFCQLDGRLTLDKYKGSYERCAKIIRKYSSRPGLDLSELYMRLVFSFIIGNSDMHLKNFSLLETNQGSHEYHLSPAYDLVSINTILPEDTEQMALTLNGKKRNLRKRDFFEFAKNCNISESSADKMMKALVSKKEIYIDLCQNSYLPENTKTSLISLIEERIDILS